MNFKRLSVFILSIGIFFLTACNLAVVTPTPQVTESQPQPSATNAPASTLTPIFFPSATPTQPTPTLTLFYAPTVTSTPSWENCPLIITKNDTRKGDLLHILRCEDNVEYDLGPFSKGVYAAGPNNNFIIYATNDGFVYGAMIGEKYLTVIANMISERFFTAINKKVLPRFFISFGGQAPYYKLILREEKYQQKRIYELPVRFGEK